MATAYLLPQPRGKKVKEKEEDQRSDVSLKPPLAAFLPRCCHPCCTAPAPVGTSAHCREPAARNEQFSLTSRQKQLKKKKRKSHDLFFPSPSPARKHIWQSPEHWKPSAGLPALQRLRGGGQACASHRPHRRHCPCHPGVPHHVGGSPLSILPQLLPPKGPGESKGPLMPHVDAPRSNMVFAGHFAPAARGKGTRPPPAPSSHPMPLPEERDLLPNHHSAVRCRVWSAPAHAQPRASPHGHHSPGQDLGRLMHTNPHLTKSCHYT